MSKARFEAALFEGHESVTAVIVPVDPEEVWELKPVKLAPRNGRADAADVPANLKTYDDWLVTRPRRWVTTVHGSGGIREMA